MSKHKITSIVVVLFLAFPLLSISQVDKSRITIVNFPESEDEDLIEANPEDLQNKKVGTSTEEVEAQLEQKRNRKNLVKFNPLLDYGRGYIPISYERMIIPRKLSIGIGLGPTFKDPIATLGLGSLFPNYADDEKYFTDSDMRFGFGLTYDAEVRYFYKPLFKKPENFNGFFVGLGFNSRTMNYTYPSDIDFLNLSEFTDRTVIRTFRLNTGYCAEVSYLNIFSFYYELNAGVGSRNYNTLFNNRELAFNALGEPYFDESPKAFNFNKIAFIFNIKFGILF